MCSTAQHGHRVREDTLRTMRTAPLAVGLLLIWCGPLRARQPQVSAAVPPNEPHTKAEDKHSAKFGDLAVTVTSMDSKAATTPDRREVTVFLTVANAGKDQAICASLIAKMETTFALEYSGASAKAPKIRELLPGESALGTYDFDVKNGVEPLELVLALQGPTLSCSANAPTHGPVPGQVRIDLHELPVPPAPAQITRPYPACLYCPYPGYTEEARHAKFEGMVMLQIIIQVDGHPGNIEITKSSGRVDLDNKAIEAVRNWRFKPATDANGVPVATIVPVEVGFRLK